MKMCVCSTPTMGTKILIMNLKKLNNKVWKAKAIFLYKLNKMSGVGDELVCPTCGTTCIKKYYQQIFCCISCKDTFHNLVSKKRLKRMKDYRGYTK